MAEMTADQITDFRSDMNDANSAWSEAEIQRLFTRQSENYNGTIVLAIDQLLMANSTKWVNYTANMSKEEREKVWAHMLDMRKIWQDKWDKDLRVSQTKIIGMRLSRLPKSRPYA